jgi:CDP-glucose 4,6-dehydratase
MEGDEKFWLDRRVFVTGATGLVGGWTVQALLDRGAHVVGLVRDHIPSSSLTMNGLVDRMNVVSGSIEDEPLLERVLAEYEIQTIIHLAAQTIVGIANRSPLSTFESNIKGTWCLLEAARRCGMNPQVIVASSDKAYGDQRSLPYTEDAPLLACHPYDASKACADILAKTFFRTYGMPICVTRCGNFYGGGDLNWNRIVPGTIRAVLRGRRPIIRTDGTLVRDYFYVQDGSNTYLHLAECMAQQPEILGQAFNFSNEIQVTVLEIVQRILRLMDSRLQPEVRGEASQEIPHQYLSAAKARRMLRWRPVYSLDEGLIRTIDWYQRFFSDFGAVKSCRPMAKAS